MIEKTQDFIFIHFYLFHFFQDFFFHFSFFILSASIFKTTCVTAITKAAQLQDLNIFIHLDIFFVAVSGS